MSRWTHSLRARTLDEILAMFPDCVVVLRAHAFRECDRRCSLEAAARRRGLDVDGLIDELAEVARFVG